MAPARNHLICRARFIAANDVELEAGDYNGFTIKTFDGEQRTFLALESHAAGGRNRSGPISPCSNGATKMPSGRLASKRAKLVFRRLKGRRADPRRRAPARRRRRTAPRDHASASAGR